MRFSILIIYIFLTSSSYAHDENLATYTIYKSKGTWLLKIDFTTNTIVNSFYAEKKPFNISAKETKKAVIEYFKKNMNFKMDNMTSLEIGIGGIKLGHHSSQIIFILNNFNKNWVTLECKLNCFNYNKNQSNLLRVKLGTDKTYKKFLNSKNQFQTIFEQVDIQIKQE